MVRNHSSPSWMLVMHPWGSTHGKGMYLTSWSPELPG